MFLDSQFWANSVDLYQTAPEGSTLFAILTYSSMVKPHFNFQDNFYFYGI